MGERELIKPIAPAVVYDAAFFIVRHTKANSDREG